MRKIKHFKMITTKTKGLKSKYYNLFYVNPFLADLILPHHCLGVQTVSTNLSQIKLVIWF